KLSEFWNPIWMPNHKTDINNNGGFSTDFIGESYDYPEASYSERESIARRHENYTRSFITFLATSPRVPENIRQEMQRWGPCKDEFQDTGGWPNQLYVREARRMISDYVMTEHNCRGTIVADDSVGLGAYNMDSHNVQRIVRKGRVENEGDVQVPVKPYPISYRSLVPKQRQCENLFVPVCLAASHIAYGSIRMEPVFMILAQSAATAGCLAIDENIPVQQVNYPKLRERLLADKQVLAWTASKAARK
ncbi:MAG: FAD-dependent oxidoreductase, partial [Verrucomicrobia subdivision 3 bacterium]|nr:FAD-dependent oxidoreductase [Limisphaerales bacterium]